MLDNGLTLAVLVLLAAFSSVQAAERLRLLSSANAIWGNDFRGGLWPAAGDILNGTSPYPPATLHALVGLPHAFYWPPPMAVLAVPLAHLPYGPAIGLWNFVCITSFVGALWLFGLCDWRLYALALLSFPFQESLYSGQAEGIQLLLLALAWRYRGSWVAGLPMGCLIASKLIAWPLLFWLIAKRRYGAASAALVSSVVLLVGSWSLIGFQGMLGYPHRLSLDAQLYEHSPLSMSAVSLLIHVGLSTTTATIASVALGLFFGGLAVTLGRGSDESWFCATILAGLLWSPLMWTHYLAVVFAGLCVSRPKSVPVWLVTACFWVWVPSHSYDVRAAVTLVTMVVLTVLLARPPGLDAAAAHSERV